ncbi:MAG: SDR family oxidoreductase [Bacteroidales bacterium]|nr:SDR family oxidoreductase [Bacteroidales bacterium]
MIKSITIGSNGYLGRHLVHFLQIAGFKNSNYDIQPQAVTGVENYTSFDITDKHSFSQLDPETDFIFLFAGLSGTAEGFSRHEDYIKINEIGLLNLLTWMRESGCRARVIFPSTRLVYRGKKDHLLKEDDPKETRTIYAVNKLAAENLLWMYQNAFGIDYTIFRICVPYGNLFGNKYSYGTIGFFMDKAYKKEDIILFGDGSIRRTFTHVADICDTIFEAILKEGSKNQIFNIGGENLSLLVAATLVADKFEVGINFMPWPEMAIKLESDDTVFDDSKLCSLINHSRKFDLKNWLLLF